MKIITDSAVYVQKNDIAYLNSADFAMPISVFMKVFGKGITIIDDSNRYDFVKFEDESDREFFKGLDWIIDYNEVKNLSEEQIVGLLNNIGDVQQKVVITFNSMSEEERRAHSDMVTQCELLEFKFYSLRDILWFKQGHISMKLPEGIDYPDGYSQEKDILKLIKTLFNKKKK